MRDDLFLLHYRLRFDLTIINENFRGKYSKRIFCCLFVCYVIIMETAFTGTLFDIHCVKNTCVNFFRTRFHLKKTLSVNDDILFLLDVPMTLQKSLTGFKYINKQTLTYVYTIF